MTLHEKQILFSRLVSQLLDTLALWRIEVAFGETWRSPEEAARHAEEHDGIKNSLHTLRLAIDLLFYKDGIYLTDTKDYELAGAYWKSLSNPEEGYVCAWGGDFSKPDGGHFSIEHNGTK